MPLLIGAHAFAQPTYFNRAYDFFSESDAGVTCLALDSVYFFSGGARNGGPWNNFLGRCDTQGALLDTVTYGVAGFEVSGRALVRMDDNLFLTTQDRDLSSGKWQVGLVRYDSMLDTVWRKQYPVLSGLGISQSMIRSTSGHLIIGGSIDWDDTLQSQMLLMQVSASGALNWLQNYGNYAEENGYGVTETGDGGFVIAGNRNPSGANNRRFLLIRTDSGGNKLWERTYGGPYDDWGGYVCRSTEGGFLLGGYKNLDPFGTDSGKAWLIKVDDSGNMEWSKTYGSSYGNGSINCSPIQLPDSSYIIVGTIRGSSYRKGWIFKITREGDLVWTRSYSRNLGQDHNYFWDFDTTSDGGFIVVGTTHNATQDAWLLKLDSLGCNAPGCDTIDGVIHVPLPVRQLEAYPNPTDGPLRLLIPDVVKGESLPGGKAGCKVQVVDVMGRNVLAADRLLDNELDLSEHPAGIYMLKVEVDGRTYQCKVVKR